MTDLNALCRRVTRGDVQALGPLLDLLEERQDWRAAQLDAYLGDLFERPSGMQADGWPFFVHNFRRLFWAEVRGGKTAALAELAARLAVPPLQDASWSNAQPSTPLADLQAIREVMDGMSAPIAQAPHSAETVSYNDQVIFWTEDVPPGISLHLNAPEPVPPQESQP